MTQEKNCNSTITSTNQEIKNVPQFEMVYEDNDILVINKSSGLIVHEGAYDPGNVQQMKMHKGSLVDLLKSKYSSLPYFHSDAEIDTRGESEEQIVSCNYDNAFQRYRPGIVHRLDQDTSGLMVIAKHHDAYTSLSKQIAERKVKRKYLAFVFGLVSPYVGTIETKMIKSRSDYTKNIAINKNNASGRIAITHYIVKKYYSLPMVCTKQKRKRNASQNISFSFIECALNTGRTHQIRVHMKYKGNPILGDCKYGSGYNMDYSLIQDQQAADFIRNFQRQALHAYKLNLVHPISKKDLEFEIALPYDMEMLYSLLSKIFR